MEQEGCGAEHVRRGGEVQPEAYGEHIAISNEFVQRIVQGTATGTENNKRTGRDKETVSSKQADHRTEQSKTGEGEGTRRERMVDELSQAVREVGINSES